MQQTDETKEDTLHQTTTLEPDVSLYRTKLRNK